MRYPLFANIASAYWGGDRMDGGLYVYLTKANIKYVLTSPSLGFSLPFLYPSTNTLAYSDNYLLPSLITKLLFLTSGNFILSYNLTIVAALLLNGYSTYLLARQFRSHPLASWWAGFVFMSLPYLTHHLQHPQLQFAFVLPLAILTTIKFCESRSIISAVIIGLVLLTAFLSCVYYALFVPLLVVLILGIYALRRWQTLRLADFLKLLFANLPAILTLLFLSFPYLSARTTFGPKPFVELRRLALTPIAYLSAPPENILFGPLTSSWSKFEGHLFPGLLTLFLAAIAVLSLPSTSNDSKNDQQLSKRDSWIMLITIASIFFAFSLGASSRISLENPFYFLFKYVPGFDAIRASGRFGIVSDLILIILASQALTNQQSSRLLKSFLLCLAISVAELHHDHHLTNSGILSNSGNTPEVYNRVANENEPGAIISLPLHTRGKGSAGYILNQTDYMHWSLVTGRATVNGYSGNIPKFHQRLPKYLKNFPDTRSLKILSSISDLRFIVFHPNKETDFNLNQFESALAAHSDKIETLYRDSEGNYLLRLNPQRTVF